MIQRSKSTKIFRFRSVHPLEVHPGRGLTHNERSFYCGERDNDQGHNIIRFSRRLDQMDDCLLASRKNPAAPAQKLRSSLVTGKIDHPEKMRSVQPFKKGQR